MLGEALEKGAQALVLQLACQRRGRRILQRLETIEDERRAFVADPFGEAPALVMYAFTLSTPSTAGTPKNFSASARKRSDEAACCSLDPWL